MTAFPLRTVVLALLSLGCLASALAGDGTAPQPVGGGLLCDQPTFDFGKLNSSEEVRHLFVLTCLGDKTVKILKTVTGCGCTTGRMSTNQVAPGQKVELEVVFRLAGRQGPQKKSIYVHTDGPDGGLCQLALQGEVSRVDGDGRQAPVPVSVAVADRPDTIRITPDRLDLGTVRRDAPASSWIEMRLTGTNDLLVTNVASMSGAITATLEKGTDSRVRRIAVRTVPPLKVGCLSGEIVIAAANKECRETRVPVVAEVEGDLAVMPGEIVVGASGSHSNAVARYLSVRSRRQKPFKVLRVTASAASVTSDVTQAGAGKGFLVRLGNLVPAELAKSGSIVIETDMEGEERVVVPVRVVAPMQATR
jgi:hypothetical protein